MIKVLGVFAILVGIIWGVIFGIGLCNNNYTKWKKE